MLHGRMGAWARLCRVKASVASQKMQSASAEEVAALRQEVDTLRALLGVMQVGAGNVHLGGKGL